MTQRHLAWQLRRELWENRSLYVAPLVTASVFFVGFMLSTIGMPGRRRATLLLEPARQRAAIGEPYDAAAMFLIVVAFIIGVFYCLDALYGERRDRSILFWKSLPISDRTTVLSKVLVPTALLPAITFVLVVVLQFCMLMWSTLVLLPSGQAASTWSRFNLISQSIILLYGLIVLALWHAPLYGWFLLVSSWAKQSAFVWAVLPFLLAMAFEAGVFHTTFLARLLKDRFGGFMTAAFELKANKTSAIDALAQLTPGRFLTTPGLWAGLVVAAIFIAAAVRLRRNREPI